MTCQLVSEMKFPCLVTGENPAAMQTGTSHRQSPSPVLWILFTLILTQSGLQKTHLTEIGCQR